MKSQDILILLKILIKEQGQWSMARLAHELFISKSEVSMGIRRLKTAGCLLKSTGDLSFIPLEIALKEFLIMGLKYVFPVKLGKTIRGTLTGHSMLKLQNLISSDNGDEYVWEYEFGESKGVSIEPLYKTVPKAVELDVELYEFLALIDIIRVGRLREVEIAKELIKNKIDKHLEKFNYA